MSNKLMPHTDSASALALRVAELSSVLKQQRDQLEEQEAVLNRNRQAVREQEEIVRMQEAQLLERDSQLQAQNAEIRALRRQHALDAEALREVHLQLQGRHRASGAMGKLKGTGDKTGLSSSPIPSPKKIVAKGDPVLVKQLQQALADKLVLVRALNQLTSEMATARCA